MKGKPGGSRTLGVVYDVYIGGFSLFLLIPLIVTVLIAFNDNEFPSLPWLGFTFDWFYGGDDERVGVFEDRRMLAAVAMSFKVAMAVTAGSVIVGTATAFLFVREEFFGKNVLYYFALAPLVIPGIVLGIALLVFGNQIVDLLEELLGGQIARPFVRYFRPGYTLVVLGQFSFVCTITMLIISARLRKFRIAFEEAAMDLGASRLGAIWSITLPFLSPSLLSAGIVAFLLSFENFPTTLFLAGNDPTLPIYLYSKLRFSVTPEINAISVVLICGSVVLGFLAMVFRNRSRPLG